MKRSIVVVNMKTYCVTNLDFTSTLREHTVRHYNYGTDQKKSIGTHMAQTQNSVQLET